MRRAVDGLTIVIRGRTTCDTVYQLAAAQDEPVSDPTLYRRLCRGSTFLGKTIYYLVLSKRQFTLSRSSAEAEYRGVANAVAETCWLRNLLRELHTLLSTGTIVYYDNVSAVYLSSNPVQHQRTKHMKIDIHFVVTCTTGQHNGFLHVPFRYQYSGNCSHQRSTYSLFDEFRTSYESSYPHRPLNRLLGGD
ncbi:ribonuclease H-like domain-containing protein [Tanacetum coccineum]